jgi:uncharacterized protein
MRHILAALALCLLTASVATAAETPPSDASIRRLLAVTEAKKLIENASSTVDAGMQAAITQALGGKTLTAREQKVLDEMRTKMLAAFAETMTWESLEPLFVDVYRRSFSQSEVDGMLTFYESAAGKAVVAKMPLVMQNTMQAMQTRMAALGPKLAQIQKETIVQLQPAPAK